MTIFTLLSSEAAIYKGQKVYKSHCVSCHTDGAAFVSKKDAKYWGDKMASKGKPLAELHTKNEKAKDSWDYFNGSKYAKKSKHLKQFLIEYAKGSNKVPVL